MKSLKKELKSNGGITLVALVVTIIVLIILAGVSISLVLGNNGIIKKAREAKENYIEAAEEEDVAIHALEDEMNQKIEENQKNLCHGRTNV